MIALVLLQKDSEGRHLKQIFHIANNHTPKEGLKLEGHPSVAKDDGRKVFVNVSEGAVDDQEMSFNLLKKNFADEGFLVIGENYRQVCD